MGQHGRDPVGIERIDRRTFVLRMGAAGGTAMSVSGLLAACGGGGSQPARTGSPASGTAPDPPARPTGVLRAAYNQAPESLDPALGSSALNIACNVYGGLMRFDARGRLVPGLATSVTSDDEATEWVFELREGVRFHDGTELDASAVARSYEHYRGGTSQWAYLIPPKVEFDASDPGVFRIKSRVPVPDVGRNSPIIHILSPKLLAKGKDAAATQAAGTGPFKFVSFRRNSSVVLEANEDFWGEGPYLERLEWAILNEPSARVAALRAGDLDFVYKVGPEQLPPVAGDGSLTVVTDTPWTGTYLILVSDVGPLANPLVRRALAHAIDRQALIDKIALGQAEPLQSLLPAGTYGAVNPSTTYAYDPDESRRLLAEAGVQEGDLTVKLAANPALTTRDLQLSQAIAQMMSDVGIRTSSDVAELTDVVGSVFTGPHKTVPDWQGLTGDLGWLNGGPVFVQTGYLTTVSGYDPAEYQRLANAALTTPDGRARERALAEIQELVATDVPVLPLYQPKISSAMKADVYGYRNPADAWSTYFGTVYRGA